MAEVEKIMIKSNEFEPEWVTVGETPIGELKVKKWIPYKEKEQMARSIAFFVMNMDEDSDTVVVSHNLGLLKEFMFISNYTNIEAELEDEKTAMDLMELVTDWLSSTGLRKKAYEVADEDFSMVEEMLDQMIGAYMDAFDATHSLAGRVKKSFAEVLNGESLGDTIAKSEDVTEKMGELLKAFTDIKTKSEEEMETSEENAVAQIPMKGGLLDLNGTQVDIRKKEDN